MGQKVNPHGLRVGVIKDWDSRWYASDEKVGDLIVEDQKIRKYLKKTLYGAGVPKIEIERSNEVVTIFLHCARPGMVIGKGGEQIEQYRLAVEKLIGKKVRLNIVEVRNPDMNAQLVAENIAQQLEKRISHRRAMNTSKPYQERRERRPRRDGDRRGGFGDRRQGGGFNRDRQGGFNRGQGRPQGGFNRATNPSRPAAPAAPAAPAKEGGAQ